jgi:hypothetical protein
MPVPGYDPNDLDETLRTRLEASDPGEYLTPAERERYENGASPLDLLDGEDVERLLGETGRSEPDEPNEPGGSEGDSRTAGNDTRH